MPCVLIFFYVNSMGRAVDFCRASISFMAQQPCHIAGRREDIMKFRTNCLIRCACALAALMTSLPLCAQQEMKTPARLKIEAFDAPAAGTAAGLGTFALGNNDEGAIVGYYVDSNVVPHGFLRTPDGKLKSFDAPGAGLGAGLNQGTVAYTLNDLGLVVGQFEDDNYVFHGYVREHDGKFTQIDAPGAGTAGK